MIERELTTKMYNMDLFLPLQNICILVSVLLRVWNVVVAFFIYLAKRD